MIETPDISLATLADARSIALLSRDAIEHGLRWTWTTTRVRCAIEDRNTNVVVARQGQSVIGFALMEYRSDDAHLLLLAVAPEHRRKRIANGMLAWLEETLHVAGIATVRVEVRATNSVGLAFYAKFGFEQVNATYRYYQGIETALHLVKELNRGTACR